MRKLSLVFGICGLLAASAARVYADDQPSIASGRKVLKNSANALIGLTAIAKLQIKASGAGSQEKEMKIDCTSLVIDPLGLSVTSLTNLNPQNGMGRIRAQGRGGESIDISIECELHGIKMRLPDGTEVPARVVLKDDDLDLAFLAPNEALSDANKKKLAVVPLESVKSVDVLDPIIQLGRTGKDFNYAPAVQLSHVAAVLTKPRTYYLGATSGLGTPVFNEQGKLAGLVTRFVTAEKEAGGDTLSTALRGGQSAAGNRVILPTADIAKLVDQAKEAAKKPAPKEE
jgi:hypothetical protein